MKYYVYMYEYIYTHYHRLYQTHRLLSFWLLLTRKLFRNLLFEYKTLLIHINIHKYLYMYMCEWCRNDVICAHAHVCSIGFWAYMQTFAIIYALIEFYYSQLTECQSIKMYTLYNNIDNNANNIPCGIDIIHKVRIYTL